MINSEAILQNFFGHVLKSKTLVYSARAKVPKNEYH